MRVRQLFISNTCLSVHRSGARPMPLGGGRRVGKLAVPRVKTTFAKRFPRYCHVSVYNTVTRSCSFGDISVREVRSKLARYLSCLDYDQTEALIPN